MSANAGLGTRGDIFVMTESRDPYNKNGPFQRSIPTFLLVRVPRFRHDAVPYAVLLLLCWSIKKHHRGEFKHYWDIHKIYSITNPYYHGEEENTRPSELLNVL